DLNRAHDFSCVDGYTHETKNAIAVHLNQGLEESSSFRECAGAQHFFHWHFEQPAWNALAFRFGFAYPDAGQCGTGERAERNLPAGRDGAAAIKIVTKYSEIRRVRRAARGDKQVTTL